MLTSRVVILVLLGAIGCKTSSDGTDVDPDADLPPQDGAMETEHPVEADASDGAMDQQRDLIGNDRSTPVDVDGPEDSRPPDTLPADSRPADVPPGNLNPVANAGTVVKARSGFKFLEGPLWLEGQGFLLFNDLDTNTTHRFTPPSTFSVYRMNNDRANGMALDPTGQIVICETNTMRVTRQVLNGALTVVANSYNGNPFMKPNDVIVRSDGVIYFTDIRIAVYRVATNGTVHLVSNAIEPNGIALSPDERTLYASNLEAVWKFPVMPDGSTGAGTKLADLNGRCDGMAIDDAGNIYTTVDAGIQVLKPSGAVWGTIPVPERPANCTFGGADRKTLFITARTGLYTVPMPIPGLP